MNRRPYIAGLLATSALLLLFVILVASISGWTTVRDQVGQYWYYLALLAVGFGVQVGQFIHLRDVLHQSMSKGVIATTGGTSTVSMISCCTHYLANIVPLIGVSGLTALVGRYQVELFWVGLAFNAAGVIVLARRITAARQSPHTASQNSRGTHAERPLADRLASVAVFIIATVGLPFTFLMSPGP